MGQQTIPVPMAIGHEFVGEVVRVGSNVADFQAGELVSGEGHVVCGRCRNCWLDDDISARTHREWVSIDRVVSRNGSHCP
jgi:threonine dehydrogenase-like Zn-dependent dehydrogenase